MCTGAYDEHIILIVYLWMSAVCYGTSVLEVCPCASVIMCMCTYRCMNVSDECTSVQAGDNTMYKNLLETTPQSHLVVILY